MSARWFVVLLVGFVVIVGGLWTYLDRAALGITPPALEIGPPAASASQTELGLNQTGHNRSSMADDIASLESGGFPKAPSAFMTPVPPLAEPSPVPVAARTRHRQTPPSRRMQRGIPGAIAKISDWARRGEGTFAAIANGIDNAAVRLRSNLADRPSVQLSEGDVAAADGRHEDAIRHYDRALRRTLRKRETLTAKAGSLVALGRFDEAAALYASALHEDPDDSVARYNYGVFLYRRSRYGEAADQFRELVRREPNHAWGWYNLATLSQRAGALADAEREWLAFVQIRPDVAGAWTNLGIVYMDFDDSAAAARCFQRALAIDSADPDLYVNLGVAYSADGDPRSALEALNAANALSPCDPIVLSPLQSVYADLANRGDADADECAEQARIIGCILEQFSSGDADCFVVKSCSGRDHGPVEIEEPVDPW